MKQSTTTIPSNGQKLIQIQNIRPALNNQVGVLRSTTPKGCTDNAQISNKKTENSKSDKFQTAKTKELPSTIVKLEFDSAECSNLNLNHLPSKSAEPSFDSSIRGKDFGSKNNVGSNLQSKYVFILSI